MEIEEEAENKLQLIDFSSEDDFLVDFPFRDSLEDFRLSVSSKNIIEDDSLRSYKIMDPMNVENAENISHQREEKLSSSETLEPRRASYLRKSIAWDNAFFSSAGVLEPEELSVMNKGFKREESSFFPGLQEDLKFRGSDDSDLMFDDDSFSLENFEGDLFEDVRASIYRSRGMSNLTNSSCEFGKIAMENVPSSAKVQVSSQNKKKIRGTSKKQTTHYQGSKTPTKSPLPPRNLPIQGVYKLKSEISGEKNAISTRQTTRASWGYGNLKNRKTAKGECVVVPKLSASLDSRHFLSFSTPPTKSSSSVSIGATKTSSPAGSSCDKFSSNSTSKSVLSFQTRTMGSSGTTVDSYSSTSKPPLRYSGRTRSRLSNPASSIHLLSMSHHLTNSPASSIDGWSSESPSSTSSAIVKRRSDYLEDNLRTDTSPASGSHQFPGNLDNHKKLAPNHNMRVASPEASHVPQEPPKNSKPSRLRLPSPKIGFFDKEKSMVPIAVDTMQFQIGSRNALSDRNPTGVKRRSPKIEPSRNVPGTMGKDRHPLSQSLHCISSTKHQPSIHSKKLDNASPKLAGMRNSIGTGLVVRTNTSFEVDNSYCSKTRKVGKGEHDRKKIVLTSSSKVEAKRTKGILKNKMSRKDHKAENGILLNTVEPLKKDNESKNGRLLNTVGPVKKENEAENGKLLNTLDPIKKDDEASRQLLVEGDLHSMCESKENFEAQVNGLSKYFERIDIDGDAIIELEAKKSNGREHRPLNEENFLCACQQGSPGITTPTPHSMVTNMDITPNTRTPLGDKNFACHESESQNRQ